MLRAQYKGGDSDEQTQWEAYGYTEWLLSSLMRMCQRIQMGPDAPIHETSQRVASRGLSQSPAGEIGQVSQSPAGEIGQGLCHQEAAKAVVLCKWYFSARAANRMSHHTTASALRAHFAAVAAAHTLVGKHSLCPWVPMKLLWFFRQIVSAWCCQSVCLCMLCAQCVPVPVRVRVLRAKVRFLWAISDNPYSGQMQRAASAAPFCFSLQLHSLEVRDISQGARVCVCQAPVRGEPAVAL